jgi:hypothetical protein
MCYLLVVIFLLGTSLWGQDCSCLFRDLQLVEQIDHELGDELPFFYNSSFVVGYFNMPSARFPKSGDLAFGASYVPPYQVYGANFAPFGRIELAANYRVFDGILESNFGHHGFGDDADRVGNVKLGILVPEDGIPFLPSIAFGLDDVIGTKRFSSRYVVATKGWNRSNFELSLGYGWGRLKGVFGGAAWSPFRCSDRRILKDLTLFVEYDANNYKKHAHEHPRGRKVRSRVNGGAHLLFGEALQLSVSSVRGEEVGASASLRFPLGSTKGLIPKVDDPCHYTSPVDVEALGLRRPEKEFVYDLACLFAEQGLDLYEAYLFYDPCVGKELHLKVVNNRYRQEVVVRERIQDLLAALTPQNIAQVKVVIEAEGIDSHSYCFRTCDLYGLRQCCIGLSEMEVLAPMSEACECIDPYEMQALFERKRQIWTLTGRPRVISFFGSTSGKFKYSLGAVGTMEGFLPGGMIYKLQASYAVYSSVHGLLNRDFLNPSELPTCGPMR